MSFILAFLISVTLQYWQQPPFLLLVGTGCQRSVRFDGKLRHDPQLTLAGARPSYDHSLEGAVEHIRPRLRLPQLAKLGAASQLLIRLLLERREWRQANA